MITIIFIAVISIVLPLAVPSILHPIEEISKYHNKLDGYLKLYWKDTVKLFSIATVAYIILSFSILKNSGKHTHEVIISAIILIVVWSLSYIYSQIRKRYK